jgi:hypothetical protein
MPRSRDDEADALRKRIRQVTDGENKKTLSQVNKKYFIIRATQAQGNQGNQIMHNKLVSADKNVSKKHPARHYISPGCYFIFLQFLSRGLKSLTFSEEYI